MKRFVFIPIVALLFFIASCTSTYDPTEALDEDTENFIGLSGTKTFEFTVEDKSVYIVFSDYSEELKISGDLYKGTLEFVEAISSTSARYQVIGEVAAHIVTTTTAEEAVSYSTSGAIIMSGYYIIDLSDNMLRITEVNDDGSLGTIIISVEDTISWADVVFTVVAAGTYGENEANENIPPYELLQINYKRLKAGSTNEIKIELYNYDFSIKGTIWADIWEEADSDGIPVNENAFWQWSRRDASTVLNSTSGYIESAESLVTIEQSNTCLLEIGDEVKITITYETTCGTQTISKNYTMSAAAYTAATWTY